MRPSCGCRRRKALQRRNGSVTHAPVLDTGIGRKHLDSAGDGQMGENVLLDRSFAILTDERAHGGLEHLGGPNQHGSRDAVTATFVLLDLLEGEAERFGELGLAETERAPADADARADGDVDWVGALVRNGPFQGESPREQCPQLDIPYTTI
jgi:hypothetical protein